MPPPASGKAVKKTGRVSKFVRAVENKKRKKRRNESFAIYIYKVLKKVHPDIGISVNAMSIMNSFLNDILYGIATESACYARCLGKISITRREIQTAVMVLLPYELAVNAAVAGRDAVKT